VSAADAAAYTVIVANSAGNVTSNSATLAVNPAPNAPAITTQPVNQTVVLADSATFSIAASGNPTPTYQWKKNGSNIAGATSATYSIAVTTLADAGSYSAVATNSVSSAASNAATLVVQNPAATADL